jgi:hypothetical protein
MRKDPRAWVSVVVVAVALGAAVSSGARVPTNAAAARVAAQRVLGALSLPPGATRSQGDPSGSTLSKPASWPGTPDLVDLHQFWRVPGDHFGVYDWIRAHPPPSSVQRVSGGEGVNGSIVTQYVGFSFGGFPTEWPSETLLVTVTAARGGATAVRADGQVVWLFERPASERIPPDVRAVTISERRLNGRPSGPWTVTDRSRVRRIVALVNSLPAGQPGAVACPADMGPTVMLAFASAAPGGKRLATAYADVSGCGFVNLWIRGHAEPFLDGGSRLIKQLGSLLGLGLR